MNNVFKPIIKVGIMSDKLIKFNLKGDFILEQTNEVFSGELYASFSNNKIEFENKHFDRLDFKSDNGFFDLHDVTIGKQFHWQQKQTQTFEGNLSLIIENDQITSINEINIEKYLKSVISSEMSATSYVELLKAHAIISRSWLMAQITKNKNDESEHEIIDDNQLIRWYDHQDHKNFDVCADDHCQRYQGINNEQQSVIQAINETEGKILTCDGVICDARFSKSCGGVTELFENCWEDVHHKYLTKLTDRARAYNNFNIDLSQEENAKRWIDDKKFDAFCNNSDPAILKQVLNNYDQKTNDFFRWKVEYSQDEISELIKKKSGIDFGKILNIKPLNRGTSARIFKLLIEGDKKSLIIGKELEIRRLLSETHLYSSAFYVEKTYEDSSVKFIFRGAGWGHGVGLCQIGAAVMASKNYNYIEILNHYYPGAIISDNYRI